MHGAVVIVGKLAERDAFERKRLDFAVQFAFQNHNPSRIVWQRVKAPNDAVVYKQPVQLEAVPPVLCSFTFHLSTPSFASRAAGPGFAAAGDGQAEMSASR